MKPIITVATAVLATSLVFGVGGMAFAQASHAKPAAHAAAPPEAEAQPGSQDEAQAEAEERRAPVLQVVSVEVLRSKHGPVLDVIRARGLTSTGAWEEGELVPLTNGTPSDGMLDLVFVARAPDGAAEATGFTPIEAVFPIEPSHPYSGIRVHGAANEVTLTELPGYAEGTSTADDCHKCVGKYFVAKGATPPDGKSEKDVVKEEHLPSNLRVIKASEGIGKFDSDPNRLTLVVGDDGRIVSVIWD
ncbi:MAG: hypothetical protein WDN04_23475 [Rhodospirillales bacterium]